MVTTGMIHFMFMTLMRHRYMEGRVHILTHPTRILTKANITTNNVQDFRIRDQISVFIANLSFSKSFQYEFPEQRDILNKSFPRTLIFQKFL